MTANLTPIYHAVKDTFEETGLVVTERYIGLFTVIFYRSFLKKFVDSFIDGPGVPPTGPDTGDRHAPETPFITGKAASGVGRPGVTSTRRVIVSDSTPHFCIKCETVIKPEEKYYLHLKDSKPSESGLPRAEYEAEHIICPKN